LTIDNTQIILLVVTCLVSFGIGRAIKHSRGKKRRREAELAAMQQAQILRDRPSEPPSNNKSKRKRQMQQESRNAGGR
jgi:hypothetical protein